MSGAFRTEQDILATNFAANGRRWIRLGDIAHVTRGPADPAQPMFRVNGRDAISLAIAINAQRRDVLAMGHNASSRRWEITATLPIGIEAALVADQTVVPSTRSTIHGRCGGRGDHPRRQPGELLARAGAVVALPFRWCWRQSSRR